MSLTHHYYLKKFKDHNATTETVVIIVMLPAANANTQTRSLALLPSPISLSLFFFKYYKKPRKQKKVTYLYNNGCEHSLMVIRTESRIHVNFKFQSRLLHMHLGKACSLQI